MPVSPPDASALAAVEVCRAGRLLLSVKLKEAEMNRIKSLLLAVVVVFSSAAYAANATGDNAPPKKAGDILVNQAGMTLYTFDKDVAGSGISSCNGPCATNWPPLVASTGAKEIGAFNIVTREDGSKQWAYKGKPLYLYKSDQKPGDRTGDNFKDIWHVVKD